MNSTNEPDDGHFFIPTSLGGESNGDPIIVSDGLGQIYTLITWGGGTSEEEQHTFYVNIQPVGDEISQLQPTGDQHNPHTEQVIYVVDPSTETTTTTAGTGIVDDDEAISTSLLGVLNPLPQTDSSTLNAVLSLNTDVSLTGVSTKLLKIPETPETLISAQVLTPGLGNSSKVEFLSAVQKAAPYSTAGVEVSSYFAPESSLLVSCEEEGKITLGKFLLPKNILLLRHPLLRFETDQSFTERSYLFPSNTENHPRNLIAATTSHLPSGLSVTNRNIGLIEECFSEINAADMNQNSEAMDLGGAQNHYEIQTVQLRQPILTPGPMPTHQYANAPQAEKYITDPLRWVYSLKPKPWLHASGNTVVEGSMIDQSTRPDYCNAFTTASNVMSTNSSCDVNLKSVKSLTKPKMKPSRKSVAIPKSSKPKDPPKQKGPAKPKQPTKSRIKNTEFLSTSINGITTNQASGLESTNDTAMLAGAYDPTLSRVQSPIVNSSIGTFPQQYLLMSPSTLPGSPGTASNNISQVLLGSIHNTPQFSPTNRNYQQSYQTTVQKTFSVPSDHVSNINSNNVLVGTAACEGNISKLSGNVVQSLNNHVVQHTVSSPNPRNFIVPNNSIRQPMFAPIQVNSNIQKTGKTQQAVRSFIPTPTVHVRVNNKIVRHSVSTLHQSIPAKVIVTPAPITVPALPSPHTLKPANLTQTPVESFTLLSSHLISSTIPAKDVTVDVKSCPAPEEPEPFTRERFIHGHEALCGHCGTLSQNLHFCEYCKFRISKEAKLVVSDYSLGNNNFDSKHFKSPPPSTQVVASLTEPLKKLTKKPIATTGVRKSKGGGKKQEECIVLSSDDEDQPKSKVMKSETQLDVSSSLNSPTCGGGGKKGLKVILSQPNCSTGAALQRLPSYLNPDEEMNFESLISEINESILPASKNLWTKVECRSVRVGDYKCSVTSTSGPTMHIVVFSEKGIMFTLPHAKNHKPVTCAVPIDTILMVEAYYKKNMPVIFLATGPRLAKSLRQLLGLSDDPKELGFHYGPQDGDKCQKRITFVIQTISDQSVVTINKIFGRTLSEIDHVKANQILCDITRDTENQSVASSSNKLIIGTSRLPTPVATASTITASTTGNIETSSSDVQAPSQIDTTQNKILLNYQGFDVFQQDVMCLADEQFLNDSILDFWLRYTEYELLTPVDRDRTYIFSTFFYKRLTTKPKKRNNDVEDDTSYTPSQKRHNRVKRWTKNVDIFEKDFLIIPINESLHWFLAVICFPGLLGVHDIETGELIQNYQKPAKTKFAKTKSGDKTESISNGNVNDISAGVAVSSPSTSDDIPDQDGTENPKPRNVKQPCILVFDSLAGEVRSRVYSTLREYLKMEYKTRKGEDRDFTKNSMPGRMPKVPQQPNHCDCGIYTLFYVECFFKYPIKSFDISSDDYKIWGTRTCSKKREEMYNSIIELIKKKNPEAIQWIPRLTFTPLSIIPPKPTKEQLKQIESAPIETIEQFVSGEEPMDIDVCSTHPEPPISRTPILEPSTVETTRASPADNDHDHDYFGVPPT